MHQHLRGSFEHQPTMLPLMQSGEVSHLKIGWMLIKCHACLLSVPKPKYLFEEGTCQHKEKVWISQSGSGLDKQQGTLQIYFCATGPHVKLSIFRGMGKCISDDGVQTWHLDVDVYFQEKAWVDTKFSCNWAKKDSQTVKTRQFEVCSIL